MRAVFKQIEGERQPGTTFETVAVVGKRRSAISPLHVDGKTRCSTFRSDGRAWDLVHRKSV